ncbi:MAG: DUF2147 domain-containing protein, partial [Vicinamibacterales bacterium]
MLPGLIAALLLVGPGPLPQPSPIGLWETRSDATGEAQSLVRIYESGGKLFGRIERLLVSDGVPDTCVACKDERKGQPLLSLVIIRNLTASGDQYKGGDILDPENGKVYRCTLRLDASGSRLTVRGYIGISLFGRSQTWRRIE